MPKTRLCKICARQLAQVPDRENPRWTRHGPVNEICLDCQEKRLRGDLTAIVGNSPKVEPVNGLKIAVALERATTSAAQLVDALAKLEIALKPLRKMLLLESRPQRVG